MTKAERAFLKAAQAKGFSLERLVDLAKLGCTHMAINYPDLADRYQTNHEAIEAAWLDSKKEGL